MNKGWLIWLSILLVIPSLILPGCASQSHQTTKELIPVKLLLDWVPNTNHTGIFVAKANGYFKEAGLDVDIIQPGEVYPEAAVASGTADFGISFQEMVTLARADNVPIVSIAAVMQHNTSGFASATALNVTSPVNFEGLRYGSFGSAFESPTLKALMKSGGGDFSKLKIVETGFSDPLALIATKQIDLAWIFYGWQGFQAQQQGLALNVLMMKDYFDYIPDYYTPVVIASEDTISNRPELVKAFMKALSRGYDFAIQNPGQAAEILLDQVPELDSATVRVSQNWISQQYQAEAPRWGEQKESVWQNYNDWMVGQGILSSPIVTKAAFTNQFLP
jgi:ABC-type nitrate/sulfonate/bicarbonate transport system substrate-binding protein